MGGPPEIAPERAEAVLAALRFARPGLGASAVRLRAAVEGKRMGLQWRVGSPTVRAAHDFGHPDFVESLRCDCRGPGTRACAHAAAVILLLAYEYPKTWHLFVTPLAQVRDEPGATRAVTRKVVPSGPDKGPVRCVLSPPPPGPPHDDVTAWVQAVLSREDGDGRAHKDLLALERHCTITGLDRTVGDLLTRLHALGRRAESGPVQGTMFALPAPERPIKASAADVRAVLGDLFRCLAEAPGLTLGLRPHGEKQPLLGNPIPLHLGLRIQRAGPGLFDLLADPPLLAGWDAGPGWVATADGELRPVDERQSPELRARLLAGLRGVPEEGLPAALRGLVPQADAHLRIHIPVDLPLQVVEGSVAPRLHVREEADLLVLDPWVEVRHGDLMGRARLFDADPFVSLSPPGARPIILARRSQDLEARCLAEATATVGRILPCSLRGEAAQALALGRLRDAYKQGLVLGWEDLEQYRLTGALSPRFAAGRGPEDLRLRFEVEDVSLAPGPVFRAWRAGQSSVRLQDGGRALLPLRWLDEHGATWEELEELRTGKRRTLPSFAAPLLHEGLRAVPAGEPAAVPVQAALEARLRQFHQIPDEAAPAELMARLRPYQHDGFRWLAAFADLGLSTCLADEMGLGKTVQTIALLLRQQRRRSPSLVVAPTSLLRQWSDECARFAPPLRTWIHHGPQRHGAASFQDFDVILTSYGVLLRDEALLAKVAWNVVVLDEAQRIRNAGSRAAAASFRLRATQRLALTGTPIENDLDELWSLFHFLMPGFFGSRRGFARRYAATGPHGHDPRSVERLRLRIRPFLLRRKKEEVARDLPPLTTRDLWCTLPDEQRELYHRIRRGLAAPIFRAVEEHGIQGAALTILEGLLRLRQAACDPSLLPPALRGEERSWPAAEVGKRQALQELLDEVVESGHRALVFSQWTSLLDIVGADLQQRRIPFTRLDGSTHDRAAVLQGWRAPGGPPVFLLSLKAGGAGLNLQEADHVIHLDPWWNPAVEAQATGRAHRIGQDRPVFAHRLLARGTLEERVLEIQARKRELADALDEDRVSVDELTGEDLRVIFGGE